jgi:hypothetical protein
MGQYGSGTRSASVVQSLYPGRHGKMLGTSIIYTDPIIPAANETLEPGTASSPIVVASQPGMHPSTQRQIIWRIFGATGAEDFVTPHLGTAANFALLAASTITNTGSTVVTGGNLGLYPGTSVTGFPPGILTPPAVEHITDSVAQTAEADALTAYNYFVALTPTQSGLSNLSTNNGGGGAGVYTPGVFVGSSSLTMPTGITLSGAGLYVFISGSTTNLASGQSITLTNGALPENVVWVVGSSFTQVATSNMVGTILANTSITLGGGTLAGRALAGIVNSGAVTIAAAMTITVSEAAGGEPLELQASVDEVSTNYVTIDTSIGTASPEIRAIAADNSADLGPDLQRIKQIVSASRFFRVFNPNASSFSGTVDITCQ